MIDQYSPEELVYIYNNYVNPELQNRVFKLIGIYKRGGDKRYGNYYYSSMISINEDAKITLKVPKDKRNELEDDVVYSLRGYICKRVSSECKIQVEFLVKDILECKGVYSDKEKANEENKVKNKKIGNRYKDLGTVLRKKFDEKNEVTIALVIGENAIVDEDIYSPLGEYIKYYKFNTYRTRLNKNSILQTLEKLKNSSEDIILLARGGGSERELGVFNDIDIAEKISEFDSVFVTAIGHAVNYNLAQEVADRKFETPSLAGKYLREVAEEAEETFNQKKLMVQMYNEIEELKTSLKDKSTYVTSNNSNVNKRIYIVLLILIIGILIGKYIF